MELKEALEIVLDLADYGKIWEKEALEDPEVLEPERKRQEEAIKVVHDTYSASLYRRGLENLRTSIAMVYDEAIVCWQQNALFHPGFVARLLGLDWYDYEKWYKPGQGNPPKRIIHSKDDKIQHVIDTAKTARNVLAHILLTNKLEKQVINETHDWLDIALKEYDE